MVGALGEAKLSAAVPASLATATARVASGVVLGRAETVAASAAVMTLASAGLRALALGKLKAVAATVLMTTCLVAGVAWTNAGPTVAVPSGQTSPAPIPRRPRVFRTSLLPKPEPREVPLPKGARLRLGTTRLRHEEHLTTVDFSPDGKTLASASWDGVVRFWDVATGHSVMEIPDRPRLGVAYIAVYSPDGTKMAIGRDGGVFQLWDLKAGKEAFRSEVHPGRVQSVAFSHDGRLLATSSSDDNDPDVRIWDVTSGKQTRVLRVEFPVAYKDGRPLAFSRDGSRLALGTSSRTGGRETIAIWELASDAKPLIISRAHDYGLSGLIFLPDGNGLVSSGSRHEAVPGRPREGTWLAEIKLWNSKTGQHVRDFAIGRVGYADGIALSRDGTFLISSHFNRLLIWNVPAGTLRQEMPIEVNNYAGATGGISISPDGRTIAARRGDNAVHLWDLSTRKPLLSDETSHDTAIMSIAFSPDGRFLATGGQDGVIQRWDVASGKHLGILKMIGPGSIHSIRYAPDGKSILASSEWGKPHAGFAGNVRVWDAIGGSIIRDIEVPNRAVATALSRDGRLVAVAEWDVEKWMGNEPEDEASKSECLIEVFDTRSGRRIAGLMGDNRQIRGLTFSNDGKMLVSIGEDTLIRTWDIDRGRQTRSLEAAGHLRRGGSQNAKILDAAISPDATIAVTSGFGDAQLIVRELRTGKLRQTIRIPGNSGSYLAIAPDGRTFASVSATQNDPKGDDLSVHLWDSFDGRELMRLDPDGRRVRSLAFSPDGKSLVTGMNDTTTLVWDISEAYKSDNAAKQAD
jgi:WD40 repeat protein